MELDVMMSIFADLGEKIGENNKHLANTMKIPKPLGRTIGGTAIAVTGVVTNLTCQQYCPVGKMWEVRLIGIFGSDTHTAVTGATADIFAGAEQDVNTSDFTGCFISATPIPFVKDYGRRHVCVYPGESVYALVTGTAGGQGLVLNAVLDEWTYSDAEQMRI
jgi:hypothetical protein